MCNKKSIIPVLVLATLATGINTTLAAITATGDITPAYDETDPWELGEGDLYIGDTAAGMLQIDSASIVNNALASIGHNTGSSGTVIVTDPGSEWNNAGDLNVGQQGTATLTIQNGATVRNAIANLGITNNTTATATITDHGSTWYCSGRMNVGLSGTCIVTLNIENGARVESPSGLVGASSISTGIANITGPGSAWINNTVMTIGLSGTGTLNITNGGYVHNTNAVFANSVSATGSATVAGSGSLWENTGSMSVGQFGQGTLNIEDAGKVTTDIAYIGYYNSTGTVTVTGADSLWDNADTLHVGYGAVGTLNLYTGATVSAGNDLSIGTYSFGTGILNLAGGTLDMKGSNLTAGDGAATFNFTAGTLKNAATIDLKQPFIQNGGTLAPGGSIGQSNILGDYQLNAGTLEIELGGIGNPHDLLTVTGNIDITQLDTTLSLSIVGSVIPGTYTIIESTAGTLTGQFENIIGLDSYPGTFDVQYTANAVNLILNALSGDLNADGFIGLDDLDIVLLHWNQTVTPWDLSSGDTTGDGYVGLDDLDLILSHWNQGTPPSNTSTIIPEPGSSAVLLLTLIGCSGRAFRCRMV